MTEYIDWRLILTHGIRLEMLAENSQPHHDALTNNTSDIARRHLHGSPGGHMNHDSTPRPLTPSEFDEMMREFDEALAWMEEQLKQKRFALRPLPVINETEG